MDNLFSPENLTALVTLSLMEIVLGIDNIIFIAILTGKLPKEQQALGRRIGIFLALFSRLALLFSITWIMGLTEDVFFVAHHGFSGRDLILLFGGLFLVGKATHEIHHKVAGTEGDATEAPGVAHSLLLVVFQVMILDIVFSLDSVITAVGMAKNITVMVVAMVIAMVVMLATAGRLSSFVERHPSIKILALSFLILIGVMLLAEGMGEHVSKGYVYFAMFFSLCVEIVNLRAGTRKAAGHNS